MELYRHHFQCLDGSSLRLMTVPLDGSWKAVGSLNPRNPLKLDQVPVLFCLQHTNVCVYTLLTQGLVFGVISTNHQGGLDLQRQAITSDLDAQRRDQNLLRVAAECQLTRHSLGCRKRLGRVAKMVTLEYDMEYIHNI